MEVNDNQRYFHMEEFKQLRVEIAGLISRVENFGKYSVVVTASIFSWLTTQSFDFLRDTGKSCTKLPAADGLLGYAWFIPSAVVILSGIMALAAFRRIIDMGAYIRQLEIKLGDQHLGWEADLKKKPWGITIVTSVTWFVLFIGTLLIGFAMQQKASSTPPCVTTVKGSSG